MREESKRQTVYRGLQIAFNQNNYTEAIKRYVGELYIQHSPEVAGGKEAFIEYFERTAKEYLASIIISSWRK